MGQKKGLEAEGRYSHGLLLTVVRSNEYLPEKYLAPKASGPQPWLFEVDPEPEDEAGPTSKISTGSIQRIEPDPSIYEPLSANGMAAVRAWSAILGQLKRVMPKAGYDKWVKDTMLLSVKEGVFVVGAPDGIARDWLQSRLFSTVTRFLTGVCNRPVAVKFVETKEIRPKE